MSALAGRRVLITGISRGVGLETARLFLREGAEVLGVAQDRARLERAAGELAPKDGRLSVIQAELTAADAPARSAAAVAERWGALDVLFNNAAVQIDGNVQGILSASEATFETLRSPASS